MARVVGPSRVGRSQSRRGSGRRADVIEAQQARAENQRRGDEPRSGAGSLSRRRSVTASLSNGCAAVRTPPPSTTSTGARRRAGRAGASPTTPARRSPRPDGVRRGGHRDRRPRRRRTAPGSAPAHCARVSSPRCTASISARHRVEPEVAGQRGRAARCPGRGRPRRGPPTTSPPARGPPPPQSPEMWPTRGEARGAAVRAAARRS